MTDPLPPMDTPEQFQAAIRTLLDTVSRTVDDALGTGLATLDRVTDDELLRVPLPSGIGIAAWAVPRIVRAVLRGRLGDQFAQLRSEVAAARTEVEARVGQVLGDPTALMELSGLYRNLQGEVGAQAHELRSILGILDAHWSGAAFTAYDALHRSQDAAAQAVAEKLGGGAAALASHAERLSLLWTDLARHVNGSIDQIANAVAGLFDLGNVVTFEVGPIVSLVVAYKSAVVEAVLLFDEYLDAMTTTGTDTWTALRTGVPALPHGTWPGTDRSLGDLAGSAEDWKKDPVGGR